jgi:formylglycine-generating enzyme required for sulfatase activity
MSMPDPVTWAVLAPFLVEGIKWAADKLGGEAAGYVWESGLGRIKSQRERNELVETTLAEARRRLLADPSLSAEERVAADKIVHVLQTSTAAQVQRRFGQEVACMYVVLPTPQPNTTELVRLYRQLEGVVAILEDRIPDQDTIARLLNRFFYHLRQVLFEHPAFAGLREYSRTVDAQKTRRAVEELLRLQRGDRFLPEDVDYLALQQVYYQFLDHEYSFLKVGHILAQFQRPGMELPLSQVYVPLAAGEQPDSDSRVRDWARLVEREERQPGDLKTLVSRHPRLLILGDPGSGKTTFVKYAALMLMRGQGQAGLGLAGDWLPIVVPIWAYAQALERDEQAIIDYLPEYFWDRGLPKLGPLFLRTLANGEALVLLDGLDEVRRPEQRAAIVMRVHDLVREFQPQGNRFVVTSRIEGYDQAPLGDEFHKGVLLPFDDAAIERFAHNWYLASLRVTPGDQAGEATAAGQAEELVRAIRTRPEVRQLASNPLMLTILALIHERELQLPAQRGELYRRCVQAMAYDWDRRRSLYPGRLPTKLGGEMVDEDYVVHFIGPVAFRLQHTEPGGLMPRVQLKQMLAGLYVNDGRVRHQARALADELIELVHLSGGLIQERATDAFGFMHQTFAEYLAGRALVSLPPEDLDIAGTDQFLQEHGADPVWREVIRLGVASKDQADVTRLVTEGLLSVPLAGEDPGRHVVRAGEIASDLVDTKRLSHRLKVQVVARLRGVMQDPTLRARTRADAGLVLGDLGELPADLDAWVEIPPGPFLYGEHNEPAELAQGFRIGRYPVTNAQFRRFVDAGGYAQARFWGTAIRRGRWADGKVKAWDVEADLPRLWDDTRFNRPNQPVVGVTWYEAMAYCAWLTGALRQAGVIGEHQVARLPSQREWQRAARGTEGRTYPWGNEFDPAWANTGESELGQTSPVDMYPGGATPDTEVYDLAGNVWEWTGDEFEGVEEAYYLAGGAWAWEAERARCAARHGDLAGSRHVSYGFRVVLSRLS